LASGDCRRAEPVTSGLQIQLSVVLGRSRRAGSEATSQIIEMGLSALAGFRQPDLTRI
jgi:hypothetical protein